MGRLGRHPDAHAWPVERVYVPVSDIWRATGLGTAAIARRRPDGKLAYGAFLLNLSEHGLSGMFGKMDAPAGDRGSLLDDMRDMIPPREEGALADASAFVYGAMALAEAQNAGFPPEEIGPYLDLLPPPPGAARQWLDGLVGAGGRTPAGLLRIIHDIPIDVDVGDGKEIAVGTEMEFHLPEVYFSPPAGAARFPWIGEHDGAFGFRYTPVPAGTSAKHGTPGKVQGEVRVRGDRARAIALSLSMAARLVADLREWLGPRIELSSVRWANSFTRRTETARMEQNPSISEGRGG